MLSMLNSDWFFFIINFQGDSARSMSLHMKTSSTFRENQLYDIYKLACSLLENAAKNGQGSFEVGFRMFRCILRCFENVSPSRWYFFAGILYPCEFAPYSKNELALLDWSDFSSDTAFPIPKHKFHFSLLIGLAHFFGEVFKALKFFLPSFRRGLVHFSGRKLCPTSPACSVLHWPVSATISSARPPTNRMTPTPCRFPWHGDLVSAVFL